MAAMGKVRKKWKAKYTSKTGAGLLFFWEGYFVGSSGFGVAIVLSSNRNSQFFMKLLLGKARLKRGLSVELDERAMEANLASGHGPVQAPGFLEVQAAMRSISRLLASLV